MSGPKTSAVRVSDQQRVELARQQAAELQARQLQYEQMERDLFNQEEARREANFERLHEELAEMRELIAGIEECRGQSWFSGGTLEATLPVVEAAEWDLQRIEQGRPRTVSSKLIADNRILESHIKKLKQCMGGVRETNEAYSRVRERQREGQKGQLALQAEMIRQKIHELATDEGQTDQEEKDAGMRQLMEALQTLNQIIAIHEPTASDLDTFQRVAGQAEAQIAHIGQIRAARAAEVARAGARRIDAGFALSFAAPLPKKPDGRPQRVAFNSQRYIQVTDRLNELDELNLSVELRTELGNLQEEIDKIRDNDYLENFTLAVLEPFVRRCRKEDEIRTVYDKLLARCQILADVCGLNMEPVEVTPAGIEMLQAQIAGLEKADMERREKAYIDQAVDEVMREMGYELVGDRTAVKRSGRTVRHELYSLNEGTAVDVTYGANGQISMELGGLDTQDREPTGAEASQLAEDMREFCAHYETLARRLADRGIEMRHMQLLPPDEQFAQIINISDYRLTGRELSGYSAVRQKKAGQMHRSKGPGI
ncbi:MAG: hypothetical protein IJ088_04065 [Clostridia bacterium]|nr:hypothetical protein [Clostridia bacterium]